MSTPRIQVDALHGYESVSLLRPQARVGSMSEHPPVVRCAIYTRKSTEEGLEQPFNTLAAQREAAEAYILSQKPNGWRALAEHYDDGGYSGASLEPPALKQLLRAACRSC